MVSNPKISIITPSFNQAQYIEQTIDSVLSQNYSNLEYVIIDGGSTDGSVDIIKKYQRYITYWVSEADKGQSDAINKGLKIITGEVVNWLNSDDYYQKETLSYVGEIFKDPVNKVLCGRSRKFNENEEIFNEGTDVYEQNLAKTIGWARIDQPETFFRKSAYDEIGLIDVNLHYLMDREWWIRYLLKYGLEGIVRSKEVLVNFRWHTNSKTISQSQSFQIDHDTIFASLAEQSGMPEFSIIIRRLFKTNERYCFPYTSSKSELIHEVFIYYFLHRTHELYYQGNMALSRQLFSCIEENALSGEDQKLYKRLKYRSIPVISSLIKGLKAWRER